MNEVAAFKAPTGSPQPHLAHLAHKTPPSSQDFASSIITAIDFGPRSWDKIKADRVAALTAASSGPVVAQRRHDDAQDDTFYYYYYDEDEEGEDFAPEEDGEDPFGRLERNDREEKSDRPYDFVRAEEERRPQRQQHHLRPHQQQQQPPLLRRVANAVFSSTSRGLFALIGIPVALAAGESNALKSPYSRFWSWSLSLQRVFLLLVQLFFHLTNGQFFTFSE